MSKWSEVQRPMTPERRARYEAAALREAWWQGTPDWPYPTYVGRYGPMTDDEWLAQAFREAVSKVHQLALDVPDGPMNAIVERSAAEGDERAKALLPTLRHANVQDADYICEHPFCAKWWPMVRAAEARAVLKAESRSATLDDVERAVEDAWEEWGDLMVTDEAGETTDRIRGDAAKLVAAVLDAVKALR